jgi:hypothetical protein
MKTIKILIVTVLVLACNQAFAQVEKYMAAFTYQICKSTTWPTQSSEFVIGVVGESPISQFFEQMSEEKKMGEKSIKFIAWGNANEIKTCNVVFIPKKETNQLSQIKNILGNKPVLIVTEDAETMNKEATISFEIIDNKIRYNLNKTDLLKRNLSIQSTIERMALKVY